jgi:transcription elongation factor Elf1
MKSLKKEIITIVALLAVALIGTYVVNASTFHQDIKAPAIEKKMVSLDTPVQEKELLLAAGTYGCADCEILKNMAEAFQDADNITAYNTFMDLYNECRNGYDDCQ